ncbi:MAG TPA: HAD-IA family hydrolase [Syntrophorhabdaceae bacterium]|nr:HAD-IA family hydrolase [Syntrophorhabdaceae bacterium]
MAIKLIIFDLDGTLINSIEDITIALNYALEPCGVNDLTTKEVSGLIGEGPSKLVEDALVKCNLRWDREELVIRFLDFYAAHPADRTVLYPGALKTLQALDGVKMAIITNKTEELSLSILKKFEIDNYFAMVVAVDTMAEHKPSPAPVLHVLSALKALPEETLIVGDSAIDIETGKASRVRTVAVTHGYGKDGFERQADFVIHSLPELTHIVRNIP